MCIYCEILDSEFKKKSKKYNISHILVVGWLLLCVCVLASSLIFFVRVFRVCVLCVCVCVFCVCALCVFCVCALCVFCVCVCVCFVCVCVCVCVLASNFLVIRKRTTFSIGRRGTPRRGTIIKSTLLMF